MIVKDLSSLQKRIERFFASYKFNREEVRFLVDDLRKVGVVAIFGGMLRDLALGGNKFFSSDVDLVIELSDSNRLLKIISNYDYNINAFGGYRIFLNKWRVDLWDIKETWAFKQHHAELTDLKSLLSTTFFNWDAIVYRFDTKEIYCHDKYLEELNNRYLDINLEQNPNELGSFVRALRLIYHYNANVSPRLINFICKSFNKHDIREIYEYQIRKDRAKMLSEETLIFIKEEIYHHCESSCNGPFTLPDKQAQLKF